MDEDADEDDTPVRGDRSNSPVLGLEDDPTVGESGEDYVLDTSEDEGVGQGSICPPSEITPLSFFAAIQTLVMGPW